MSAICSTSRLDLATAEESKPLFSAGHRHAQLMKAVLFLLSLMLALLAIAALATSGALDEGLIQDHAREVRERAARLPIEDFLVDRANRMRGRVVTSLGIPVGAVRVTVYDIAQSEEDVGSDPGLICPENCATTADDGSYELLNLSYGPKVVTFHGAGFTPAQAFEISFGDGYGAKNVDGILTDPHDGVTVFFQQSNEAPAKRLALTWLSDVVDASTLHAVTDAEGSAIFPGPPHNHSAVLVGFPPCLIEFSVQTPRVHVPDASTLRLRCSQDVSSSAHVTLLPAGAKWTGAYTAHLRLDGGVFELPNVMHGTYSLVIRTELSAAFVEIDHDGCEHQFELTPLGHRRVRVTDQEGNPVSARLTWSATRRSEAAQFWSLRRLLHDQDPTAIGLITDAFGNAELPDLAAAGGWLTIAAEHRIPEVCHLAASTDSIEVHLDTGFPLYVKTQLPFLPVATEEGPACPASYQRTGANAEAVFWTRSAPVVVRSGFHRGALSLPRGGWPGEEQSAINMTLMDIAEERVNCVYGFALDLHGRGVASAEVFIQGPERLARATTSEATGFFRFVGLRTGNHHIMARPAGMRDSLQISKEVVVHEGEWLRSDVTIWPGRIAGVAPERTKAVQLQDKQDEILWIGSVDKERRYSIGCVPPGTYTVTALDEEETPLEVAHPVVPEVHVGEPEGHL